MYQQTTSRILRTPPGTRGGLSGVSARTQPVDPLQTAINALVFVAALFTLGFFAITNWSGGSTAAQQALPIAELTPVQLEAQEIENKLAMATSPSALDSFYSGGGRSGDPYFGASGPIMAEDGSGIIVPQSGYGAPTAQLLGQETGGWAAPFSPPQQDAL